jgi:putative transposase
MLDGVELKGRCCVVALGIDTDGVKHPLGLWDGSTENATVATTLLANSSNADSTSSRACCA